VNKWDYRFLRLAREVATYSKDPSTQLGCVLVSPDREKVVIGYNGFPKMMEDKPEWLNNREEKYSRIIHAEVNAKNNAACSLKGWTNYTWPLCSCERCMVQMAGAGIVRFVAPILPDSAKVRWGDPVSKSRQYAIDMNIQFDELDFPTTFAIEKEIIPPEPDKCRICDTTETLFEDGREWGGRQLFRCSSPNCIPL